MIGKLKGAVEDLKPTEVIIDVNGVGFELTIPFSTYEKIQGEKRTLRLLAPLNSLRTRLLGGKTVDNEENKPIALTQDEKSHFLFKSFRNDNFVTLRTLSRATTDHNTPIF